MVHLTNLPLLHLMVPPLGADEVTLTKEFYKWEHEPFHVPDEVYQDFQTKIVDKGESEEKAWNELFASYKNAFPELAKELDDAIQNKLPENWDKDLPVYKAGEDTAATRATSGEVLNAIAKTVPSLFGGSADLAGSNKTNLKDAGDFSAAEPDKRNIWFGVREFAMAAALNGMALHGGLKVFGGTFFVFSDYLRPAVRLSAIQNLPVTYVLTHDSIAVGEDGPTHEPVEQLAAFRAMPNLSVIRPADGNEVQAAWRLAIESTDQPTALVLTRQNLPTLEGTAEKAYEGVKKGGYIVSPSSKETPDAILVATGSEVQLAVKAQVALKEEGKDVSVVSIPSWDRFDKQDAAYKESVLPKAVKKRVGIEMASSLGWERYVGTEGAIIAIDRFGASANGNKIIEEYGFTVENVVKHVHSLF